MSTWAALEAELDIWDSDGRQARFWWRDDDTHEPGPTLDRLLDISSRHTIPMHLAVIPRRTGPELSRRLAASENVYVMQHGFQHRNHEPSGAGASEIGRHRPIEAQLNDLAAGWRLLEEAQMPNLLPVLAPPWNRIGPDTVPHLPNLGYRLLTTFTPRETARPCPDLLQVNCHLDPIRWKTGAEFRGEEKLLRNLIAHLEGCRTGAFDATEPVGVQTHHLQTDEPTWDFMVELAARLSARPAVTWVSLADILNAGDEV